MTTPKEPSSPCVSICALDHNDVCVGCLRSGEEISRWGEMSAADKIKVLKKVARREAASSLSLTPRTS